MVVAAQPSLDALIQGLGAKRVGAEWKARCPAHEDGTPSLGMREKNGVVVVKCYGGCEQRDVIAALRARGLWPDASATPALPVPVVPTRPLNGKAPAPGTAGGKETRYEYHDAAGALVAIHRRTDLPDGKKRFTWLTADGRVSEGDIKTPDVPLYGLRALGDAPADAWVVVTEGEKAADAARGLGLLAVSLPGGSGQTDFGASLNPLHGRRVALWPDNDAPGRAFVARVQAALKGKAARVVVLDVPGLPDKGDAADFKAAKRTGEEVRALIDAATAALLPRTFSAGTLLAREFPPPRAIVRGVLYEGAMLLAGRPKLGKSWAALCMALAKAYGGHALGRIPCDAGDVLYLALEDGERRLQTRLAGLLGEQAPPERLTLATDWPRLDAGGLEALDVWLAGHPEAHLVVIDTLKRVRPRDQDGRRQLYDLDYEAVAPLNDLAHQYGVCILIVHHTRKADAEDPLDLISGTLGLTGAVDGAIVLKRGRGQMDATISVTCRDAEDCELALRWDGVTAGWLLLGDAADFKRGAERTAVLRALHQQPGLYPREVAALINAEQNPTRVLLFRMATDGEVRVQSGRYFAVAAAPPPEATSGAAADDPSRARARVGNTGNAGNDPASPSGNWPKTITLGPLQTITPPLWESNDPASTITPITGITHIPPLPPLHPLTNRGGSSDGGGGEAPQRIRRVL